MKREVFLVLGVVLVIIHLYAWTNDLYNEYLLLDKAEHFLSGLVITGLVVTSSDASWIDVLLIILILGSVWELAEVLLRYDAEQDALPDIVANEVGAVVGLLIAREQ